MSTTTFGSDDPAVAAPKGRRHPFARGATLVVFSTGGAFAARWALEPIIHERMPYILFVGAVAASTRWAGWKFGTATAGISMES